MARIGVVPALMLVVFAGQSSAGAWPREPGSVFLSFRVEDDGATALYGEYGLTRRLTLGGQIASGERHEPSERLDLPPPRDGRASSFARIALGPLDAPHRFAFSLGVSAPPDTVGMSTRPRAEAAVHWGYGFDSALGGGWATATARILSDPEQDQPITDLSALIGLRPAERTMSMIAVARWQDSDGTYWKISPSVGYEILPDLWVVPQISRAFGDASDTRASLSVWLSF